MADEISSQIGFGFLEAAKKHRQVLDVAFPSALAIERGLDSKSQMCVAQQDIEKYYDNIRVLRVARWLEQRFGCIDLVTTLVAMHSCSHVKLEVGGEPAVFTGRSGDVHG